MGGLQPGAVLGERFEIVGMLGHGGMATVYLAQDRLRDEPVALKVLHGHLARSAAMRSRLRREVQAASRLRHPHALVAWDLHELDGTLAVSMPLHRGSTLAEYVERHGPLTASALDRVARQLVGALREAHACGIVHRDVTPTNVMVDDQGEAMLTDFGLARFTDQRTATGTGALGTAGFAAPEVYEGVRSDPRSDVYSLGAVLYQAATGVPPFRASDPMSTLKKQLADDREPLGAARPDLPEHLVRTIEAMLALEPGNRPQGAAEVLEALEHRRPPPARGRGAEPGDGRVEARHHLPPGDWTVLVAESGDDRERRRQLRHKLRRQRAHGFEADVTRAVDEVKRWVMNDMLGVPPTRSPEERLAEAVALEAELPRDALEVPQAMLERRFRLVETVSEETARRLARAAEQAGFTARPLPAATLEELGRDEGFDAARLVAFGILGVLILMMLGSGALVTLGALGLELGIASGVFPWMLVLFVPVFMVVGRKRGKRSRAPGDVPLAFGSDLRFHLAPDADVHLPALPAQAEPPEASSRHERGAEPPETPSRHQRGAEPPQQATEPETRAEQRHLAVLERARTQLDGLHDGLEQAAGSLPAPALRDLRATAKGLRARVEDLGRSALDLQRELGRLDERGAAHAVDRIEGRLERLRTLARTGDGTDTDEIRRLETALARHREVLEQTERVEGKLTLVLARLLEVGAAAARARLDLLERPEPEKSAEDLLQRLKAETADASRALAEVEAAPGRLPREPRREGAPARRRPRDRDRT